jgi:hypothetical protein
MFFVKISTQHFLGENVTQNIWATYVYNFQKMPKLSNRPIGKNLTNLVTLF